MGPSQHPDGRSGSPGKMKKLPWKARIKSGFSKRFPWWKSLRKRVRKGNQGPNLPTGDTLGPQSEVEHLALRSESGTCLVPVVVEGPFGPCPDPDRVRLNNWAIRQDEGCGNLLIPTGDEEMIACAGSAIIGIVGILALIFLI